MNKKGKLYIVGTPIGNLSDISARGLETLKNVDFIAAEDTRVTLKLLNHFNIQNQLISYYEYNKIQRGQIIVDRILLGEDCALVTDAGMPCISDPGEDLIQLCYKNNIKALVVPGPSAVVSALALSGISAPRFTFEGFLSTSKKTREDHLTSLKEERRTMVFYESPHRLKKTLIDLYSFFGDRKLSIVRELTKVYEEVIRTTTKDAPGQYGTGKIKGEIVLVLEGNKSKTEIKYTLDDAVKLSEQFIKEGDKLSDATKKAAEITKIRKNKIYKELI